MRLQPLIFTSSPLKGAAAVGSWPVWHGRELITLMGPPGSGKSTYAARYPLSVSTDRPRALADTGLDKRTVDSVYEPAFARIIAALKGNQRIVFDTTAANPVTRKRVLTIARAYKAKATLVVFTTPLDVCIARQGGRAHPVGAPIVRRMHAAIAGQHAAIQAEGWTSIVWV